MIVSIHQPAYLPWLGYFARIAMSDAHVILDDVQFEKNSFINRNKIRTPDGCSWLTVPVKTAGKFGQLPINQVEIANDKPWRSKHWNTLRSNYARARFFGEHAGFFEATYRAEWSSLAELIGETTGYLLDAFGIATQRYYASQLNVGGKKDELILNICRELGATEYLSGPLGRNYLREELFREREITIHYHEYDHPSYAQAYPGFQPYLAAVDLLFNAGAQSLRTLSTHQELVAP